MKNGFTMLTKSVQVALWLTAATSTTDTAIQEKMFESGTTLVICDQEVNDIMKIFKSLIKNGKKLSKITKQRISRNVVEYIKCPFI